jgi:hypothetical protein
MPTVLSDTTVRLEPAVKDALQAEAAAEDRSLSFLIRRVLRQHVRQQQRRRRVMASHLRLVALRPDGGRDDQADNNP